MLDDSGLVSGCGRAMLGDSGLVSGCGRIGLDDSGLVSGFAALPAETSPLSSSEKRSKAETSRVPPSEKRDGLRRARSRKVPRTRALSDVVRTKVSGLEPRSGSAREPANSRGTRAVDFFRRTKIPVAKHMLHVTSFTCCFIAWCQPAAVSGQLAKSSVCYALSMDILLSHTTALEALRTWGVQGLIESDRGSVLEVPARVVREAELCDLIDSSPLLQTLSAPLHLLSSGTRASRRTRLVHEHLQRDALP